MIANCQDSLVTKLPQFLAVVVVAATGRVYLYFAPSLLLARDINRKSHIFATIFPATVSLVSSMMNTTTCCGCGGGGGGGDDESLTSRDIGTLMLAGGTCAHP